VNISGVVRPDRAPAAPYHRPADVSTAATVRPGTGEAARSWCSRLGADDRAERQQNAEAAATVCAMVVLPGMYEHVNGIRRQSWSRISAHSQPNAVVTAGRDERARTGTKPLERQRQRHRQHDGDRVMTRSGPAASCPAREGAVLGHAEDPGWPSCSTVSTSAPSGREAEDENHDERNALCGPLLWSPPRSRNLPATAIAHYADTPDQYALMEGRCGCKVAAVNRPGAPS